MPHQHDQPSAPRAVGLRHALGLDWARSAMESFFGSLKTERTARKVHRPREQARSDVFDYMAASSGATTRRVATRHSDTSVR